MQSLQPQIESVMQQPSILKEGTCGPAVKRWLNVSRHDVTLRLSMSPERRDRTQRKSNFT